MIEIEKLLDDLAEMRSNLRETETGKQALIDSVLTDEIRQKMDDIETEFAPLLANVQERIAKVESAIKEAVLQSCKTVKGRSLQAVWSKPRVTWDTKALDGYVAAHPEVEQFRKEGRPSVSIRLVK